MSSSPTPLPQHDSQHDERDQLLQQELVAPGGLPAHIAIIMDGDRRWAKERGLEGSEGHRHGRESVRDIVRACGQLSVEVLTLYTFSTENWKRPETEVSTLMRWLRESLNDETPELHANNVRLNAIGALDGLPRVVQMALNKALADTAQNDGLILNLAINYGGRSELVNACRRIAGDVLAGRVAVDDIDEELINTSIYTSGLPDPDLLIRCSGEMRLSNFLPWQTVYSEIYFTPTYWPDFRRHHLYEAIRDFQQRHRRLGT
jgi:undecaprenyl diphosphate synthase